MNAFLLLILPHRKNANIFSKCQLISLTELEAQIVGNLSGKKKRALFPYTNTTQSAVPASAGKADSHMVTLPFNARRFT